MTVKVLAPMCRAFRHPMPEAHCFWIEQQYNLPPTEPTR